MRFRYEVFGVINMIMYVATLGSDMSSFGGSENGFSWGGRYGNIGSEIEGHIDSDKGILGSDLGSLGGTEAGVNAVIVKVCL